METIVEAKAAVERGQTVHWKTNAYELKKYARGDWWVVCLNGHVAPINGHNAEDFYAAESPLAVKQFSATIVREYTSGPSTTLAKDVDNQMELYRNGDRGRIDWTWGNDGYEEIGLIFEDMSVVDYDGVFELPREARMLLIEAGFDLEPICYDKEGNDIP
jgi:hypothetical protein